jgi:hypothetical protein
MNVVLAKTETAHAPSDILAVARDRLPGAGKVADLRRQALDAYTRLGLPHRPLVEHLPGVACGNGEDDGNQHVSGSRRASAVGR